MNQMYGFEGEIKAKYTVQMFQLFSEVFQWLPLAQCINSKVLVRSGAMSLKQPQGPATKCNCCSPACFVHKSCSRWILCYFILQAVHADMIEIVRVATLL